MAGYPNQKQKTPGRAVRRFCMQIAASFGVFFLVLTLFQSTSPGSIPWKQWVRGTFTADFDAAPVMEFFYTAGSKYGGSYAEYSNSCSGCDGRR